jgi:hypothetical protein
VTAYTHVYIVSFTEAWQANNGFLRITMFSAMTVLYILYPITKPLIIAHELELRQRPREMEARSFGGGGSPLYCIMFYY